MKLKMRIIKHWFLALAATALIALVLPLIASGQTDPGDENAASVEIKEDLPIAEEPTTEYTGTMSCLMCHEDYKEGYLKTRHALSLGDPKAKLADQGCEQCHGPGSMHIEMLGNEPGDRGIFGFIEDKREEQLLATCLRCHKSRIDKGDWLEGYHANSDVFCTSCHTVHEKEFDYQLKYETSLELCFSCHTTMRPLFEGSRSHHPLKDDTGCTICHDPHGEPDFLLLTENLEDKCGRCHSDRSGPFIYQHMSGTSDFGDGCMSCHTAHASGNLNLLKANGRALCLSCHTELAEHKGAATCWTSGCHSQIHGSNSNMLFIR